MTFALGAIAFLSSLILNVLAASFPPTPERMSIVNSTHFPGRSILYKEVSIVVLSGIYLTDSRDADSQKDSNLRDDSGSQVI